MADVDIEGQSPVGETATSKPTTEVSSAPEGGNEISPNEPQENQETQEQVDWKKRYSDSSKEAQRLREEAEAAKRLLAEQQEKFLQVVTKDRETYEDFINEQGLSPQEKEYYMNIYDTRIAPSKLVNKQGKATETPSGTPSPSPEAMPMPTDPIRESWMNRLDAQERAKFEAQTAASREFFSREENKKLPPMVQESIKATAAMLDQEFGYEPKDALETARKRLLEPEALRNEGYAEGVRDSFGSGVSRGISGGMARTEESVKLPPKDEAFIQLEIERKGLKGDAAKKLREAYAERLARRNS